MNLDELKQQYGYAIVSLVFCKPSKDGASLVFAEIEYMPTYLPRSDFRVEDCLSVDKGRAKLWYERFVLSIEESYTIFRSAAVTEDFKIVLWENGKQVEVPIKKIAPDLQAQRFVFTRGPRYSYESPIIARCWHGAQVDTILALDPSPYLSEIIAEDKAATWISDHLCFSLTDCVEYLSGVVAVYPNPYYCQAHLRMVPSVDASGVDQIVVRYDRDCSDQGLKLLLTDQLSGTYGQIREVSITGFETRVNLGSVAGEVGYAVTDSCGRVIDAEKFTPFIRGIRGEISVVTVKKRNCKDGTFQFLPVKHPEGFSIGGDGTSLELELDGKIRALKYSREQRHRAKDQYAFYKEPGVAERLVWRLINSARKNVLIIDPYFSDEAAKMYLEATEVPVDVLCTEGGLKCNKDASDGVDHGKNLLEYVNELNRRNQNVNVYVTGHSDLHDRFIVLDENEVWLLGSSLKDIGASLSVVTKMNDGEGVAQKLYSIKEQCHPLPMAEWLHKSRGEGGGGEELR